MSPTSSIFAAGPSDYRADKYDFVTDLKVTRLLGRALPPTVSRAQFRRLPNGSSMTASGQSRRFGPPSMTPVFPREADTVTDGRHVSKVPN